MSNQKKAKIPEKMENDGDSFDEDDLSDEEGSNPDVYKGNEVSCILNLSCFYFNVVKSFKFQEIQVDFEGRNPIDSDYDGIKQLLNQLFRKAHINISEMSNVIIGQNYVGSVIKQSWDEEMDDEEEDDMDSDDSNLVFGVTTAINITHRKETECVQQLRTYILEKAEKHATDATLKLLRDILGNEGKPTGFLINERFINIPAQIAVPMLDSLVKEIKRANDKKMPYNFSYFLILLKFHRQASKKQKPTEDLYSNPEEEVFIQDALASFDFSIETEADSGLTGNWQEEDETLTPFRKLVVLDAKKLPEIVDSIQSFINNPV